MMYGDYGSNWAWMMVVMPLMWLALVGFSVWIVARLIHSPAGGASSHPAVRHDRESPEEILDRRFAMGEIDAEAHAAARKQLKDHTR